MMQKEVLSLQKEYYTARLNEIHGRVAVASVDPRMVDAESLLMAGTGEHVGLTICFEEHIKRFDLGFNLRFEEFVYVIYFSFWTKMCQLISGLLWKL